MFMFMFMPNNSRITELAKSSFLDASKRKKLVSVSDFSADGLNSRGLT